ncbi:MAG: TSUP family transporter, partial [Candidatus Thorarchaeota archaeon]
LGFVTGLIGIGGGVLVVPVMVIFLNFHMHEAVGSSTAMMIFTSLGGALSYMILGLGVAGLPEFSIGYVNLLQWVLLAGTSIPMAQVGAHIAHKINAKALKWIFIVVMIYMALKMIGVFDLLGLPI